MILMIFFISKLSGKGNSVANYKNAKSAYGDFMTTAKAGTSSVNDNIFTPNQLLRASKAADKSVGKKQTFLNQGRMQDIGKQGQDILGRNIGDSGTTIRSAALNMMSGAGMGGASYAGGPAVAIPAATYMAGITNTTNNKSFIRVIKRIW